MKFCYLLQCKALITSPVTLLNSPCFWCLWSFTVAALSFAADPVPQWLLVPLRPFVWPSPRINKLNLSPSCSPCFATSEARISSICFWCLICCSRATCSRSIIDPPATLDLRAVFSPIVAEDTCRAQNTHTEEAGFKVVKSHHSWIQSFLTTANLIVALWCCSVRRYRLPPARHYRTCCRPRPSRFLCPAACSLLSSACGSVCGWTR